MRLKPTQGEAICLAIGLLIGALAVYLIRPKTSEVKLVVPYDKTRSKLVVTADSAQNAVTIVQKHATQSLNSYDKARARYDTLTVVLP